MSACFPRALRSLKGWERLQPSQSREPLPYYACLTICCHLLSQGKIAMALAIHLGFVAYLRPRELTSLTV
eukprot:12386489-Karenia_brevis.AAC.1